MNRSKVSSWLRDLKEAPNPDTKKGGFSQN
jgi:hypothetical protein